MPGLDTYARFGDIPRNPKLVRVVQQSNAKLIFDLFTDNVYFKSSFPWTAWFVSLTRITFRLGQEAGPLLTSIHDINFQKCSLSAWLQGMFPEMKNLSICSSII